MNCDNPLVSAIVVIPDQFETVRRTVRALQAQTIASQMEIVFVAPNPEVAVPEEAVGEFRCTQTIVAPLFSVASGYAAGIRHARGAFIVLTEDHSFPEPHWAERLVAAHQGNHAVVAPSVRNGNPNSAVSWANFLIDYGQWAESSPPGTREFLPGHNGMYRRSALEPYMERLEEWLKAETVLHWDMRQHGHTLWLESSTFTRHYNFELWKPFLSSHWQEGRIFAARRALSWHWARRAAYVLASPLIPPVRFARVRRTVQRMPFGLGMRARVYAAIWVGLVADGLAQGLGYLGGAANVREFRPQYEFHRFRYIKQPNTLNHDA